MADKIEELSGQTGDAATGAAAEIVEATSDPVGTATRQARRLERRGAPVNRHVERRVRRATARAVQTTTSVLDGTIPERLLIRSLHVMKNRARRRDLVGEAAFRYLQLVHRQFGRAAKSLSRFEDASQPPARANDRRRTETPVRKAAGRSASQAKSSARRTARGASTAARRGSTPSRQSA